MQSKLSKSILGLLCLLLGVLSVANASHAATEDEGETLTVALVESWPSEGIELWVPSREGRLVFSGPVNPSTAKYELRTSGPDSTVVAGAERVAYGVSRDTVLFKIPELSAGAFELTWSVETADGRPLTGVVQFSVAPTLVAPGGANHRMEGTSVKPESLVNFLLRIGVLAVLSVMGAFFLYDRASSNTKSGYANPVLHLSAGIAVSLLGVLGLFTTLYDSLERDKHTDSLEHYVRAFTTPLLFVYLAVVFIGAYHAVRAPSGNPMRTAVLTSVLFALATPASYSFTGYARSGIYAALLVSACFLARQIFYTVALAILRRAADPRPSVLIRWFLAVAALSPLTVLAQSGFHRLLGDHAENAKDRLLLVAVGVVLVLLLALMRRGLTGNNPVLRFLLPIPVALVASAIMVLGFSLTQSPPVMPGL